MTGLNQFHRRNGAALKAAAKDQVETVKAREAATEFAVRFTDDQGLGAVEISLSLNKNYRPGVPPEVPNSKPGFVAGVRYQRQSSHVNERQYSTGPSSGDKLRIGP